MNSQRKRAVGLLFWIGVVLAGAIVGLQVMNRSSKESAAKQTAESIIRFVGRRSSEFELVDPAGILQVGDPIFLEEKAGQYRQVGAVESVLPSQASAIRLVWYEPEIAPEQCQMFQYRATGRLAEVVATMMPPDKRDRIKQRLSDAVAAHGDRLSAAFLPLVQESLRKSMPIIEDELDASVARHRDEIDATIRRWNDQIVEERLIPLAKEELLPIVRKHAEPPAEVIGREIWDRASLFRFGWRAVYDKTPLPKRDLVREEWRRFVDEEALPVLEKHMDEIVIAIQQTLRDVSSNQAVRRELAGVAGEIASDPQSRAIIQTILNETLVNNDRLKLVWREVWTSDRAKQAFAIADESLEPVIRQIGDEVFGSEELGIDPDFARVLRSQILRKDRRWVVAMHTGASNGRLEVASDAMPYPIVYMAEQD